MSDLADRSKGAIDFHRFFCAVNRVEIGRIGEDRKIRIIKANRTLSKDESLVNASEEKLSWSI